ncbi:MAG: methionine biosynthesis protein MetW [Alphaproteobacteria bacterium]|jgi:methionine biosynthesis protein MetW|nr:methionine biosynthesis protein MetW [Alphaproteobacteria bacterium]MDP6566246.1 methionine biosynthesis protein MetW [Alphaproteobacteria bacterium]MDP6814638.1 methionine biosynthesis protein MetW [Alphaproteobacteria bacterium]
MTGPHRFQPAGDNGASSVRPDFRLLADMVTPRARVLDIGCENGDLLQYLRQENDIDGRGMELSQEGVNASVARGLSVVQGDADTDLVDYPDDAFDFVILSQSLQVVRFPNLVLEQMLRIGERAIVSFPNFGYWRVRWHLFAKGRMPMTKALPIAWYETANIHFCTILDFLDLCQEMQVRVERGVALDHQGRADTIARSRRLANLFGEQGIFLLRRK